MNMNEAMVNQTDQAEIDSLSPVSTGMPSILNMNEAMKQHIESVLQLTKGKIQGEDGAAALLGLPPSTLRNRMKKLDVIFRKN